MVNNSNTSFYYYPSLKSMNIHPVFSNKESINDISLGLFIARGSKEAQMSWLLNWVQSSSLSCAREKRGILNYTHNNESFIWTLLDAKAYNSNLYYISRYELLGPFGAVCLDMSTMLFGILCGPSFVRPMQGFVA